MKRSILFINLLIGFILVAFPIISSPDIGEGWRVFQLPPFKRSLFTNLLILGFYFLNFYVLVPKYYFTKKYLNYSLLCLFIFGIVLFAPDVVFPKGTPQIPEKVSFFNSPPPPPPNGMIGEKPPIPPNGEFPPPPNSPPKQPPPENTAPSKAFSFQMKDHYNVLVQFVFVLALSLLLRLLPHLERMRNEKLQAELTMLKAQINPHFLFNTLNAVYSVAVTEGEKTPIAVAQLSDYMRYLYNDSEQELISLSRELEFIENYIALQKIRFGEDVSVNFTHPQEVPEVLEIHPLLLMTFIENAFKYGVSIEEHSKIDITAEIVNETLHFDVRNKIFDGEEGISSTKTGIKNTRERLNHLYPQQHKLQISEKNNTFIVKLELDLQV